MEVRQEEHGERPIEEYWIVDRPRRHKPLAGQHYIPQNSIYKFSKITMVPWNILAGFSNNVDIQCWNDRNNYFRATFWIAQIADAPRIAPHSRHQLILIFGHEWALLLQRPDKRHESLLNVVELAAENDIVPSIRKTSVFPKTVEPPALEISTGVQSLHRFHGVHPMIKQKQMDFSFLNESFINSTEGITMGLHEE